MPKLTPAQHLRLLNRALDTFEDEVIQDWIDYAEDCPGISEDDAWEWLCWMRDQHQEAPAKTAEGEALEL
jgi:hypothetical protein